MHLLKVEPSNNLQMSTQSTNERSTWASTTTKTIQQLIQEGFGTKARNMATKFSVGDIMVPLCGNLTQRQLLANRGIYTGVDYKICEIKLDGYNVTSMTDVPPDSYSDVTALIRPKYPLRDHLERPDWPVTVKPAVDVPLWLSEATYQAGTAVGTLALSFTFFSIAAVLAFFIRIVYVPTESMYPSLDVGDVILVTRSIPLVASPKVNDVVLFDPPKELDAAILNSKLGQAVAREAEQGITPSTNIVSTKGKQLLKRVMAVPGESVGVHNSQPFAYFKDLNNEQTKLRIDETRPYDRADIFDPSCWNRPAEPLNKGQFFVAGDNGASSVDSRVWGPLKEKYIFGTAKWVLYPWNHFGSVPSGPFLVQEKYQSPSIDQ